MEDSPQHGFIARNCYNEMSMERRSLKDGDAGSLPDKFMSRFKNENDLSNVAELSGNGQLISFFSRGTHG